MVNQHLTFRLETSDAATVFVKVSRLTDEIARVFFVNESGEPVPKPPDADLYDQCTERRVELHNGEWLITWAANYELVWGSFVRLRFTNPRQLFVYQS